MALDTQNKRGAMMGLLPVPDGAITELDRKQFMFLFIPGISAVFIDMPPGAQFKLTDGGGKQFKITG